MWEIGVQPQRPHQQVKHLHLPLEHQEPLILHLKMEEVHREGESMIQRLVSACTQWGWTDGHQSALVARRATKWSTILIGTPELLFSHSHHGKWFKLLLGTYA